MEDAADLLLVLRDFGFVSIKNKKPVVELRTEIAGTHHPDGVFLAYGRGIKQGVVAEKCNIVDVGATLLYSLGLEVPSDLEGKVPHSIFNETYLSEHPIVIGTPTNKHVKDNESARIDEDEKEKIMEQLRLLGYME